MRIYRCQHCNYTSAIKQGGSKAAQSARNKMGEHYETKHKNLLPPDMDGYRYFYFLLTKKENGSCIICHNPTEFNRITMKYARFCDNPKCKQKYKEDRDKNVFAKYGKLYMTDDPEFQKKMQAGRRIAGVYTWSDGKTKLPYLSSYEMDFFKFLDQELHWPPTDIIAPSPHIFEYEYNGVKHFYMPDAFIPSINLEIEIKSSVRQQYHDPDSRAKEIEKDKLMKSCDNLFNYIIIYDKNYTAFKEMIAKED